MVLNRIRDILGQPFYHTDNCFIYNMDCLQALKKLPAEIIWLTVTSPPYNIGKAYENPMALEKYLDWCEAWVAEIYRITRPNGAFWLNLGYFSIPDRAKAIPIPYLLWDRIPFHLIQEIIWNYGAGVAGKKFFSPRNEKFLWYVKNPDDYTFNLDAIRDPNVKYPNQKKNGKIKVNPNGKNPTDVWQFPKVTSGKDRASTERTSHPAQFPMAVIERIIKASSNPRELVLDPFIGSGTTAEIALRLDRPTVGFEIREDYCRIVADRLDNFFQHQKAQEAQLELFGASKAV
jgi:adenine-specific DNA-methyltransferase